MKYIAIFMFFGLIASILFGDVAKKNDTYVLKGTYTVQESGPKDKPTHPDWWVNSGGYFYVENNIGKTVQGRLPENDKWRLAYSKGNEESRTDTENGFLPQNLFRLISRSKWQDVTAQCYFRINTINMTDSPNRAGHNGILFMLRYADSNNLYYVGIRVDGHSIVKKKIGGKYFTLEENSFFDGNYDREKNPSLIPTKTWIGLQATCINQSDKTVKITILLDKGEGKKFIPVMEVIDKGDDSGKPFLDAASVGIRTDFMDVEFKDLTLVSN